MKVSHLRSSTILFGGLVSLLCIPQNTIATVTSREVQALTDLYYTMNGPNWRNKANWLSGDSCSAGWAGITCSGGYVTGFQLDNSNIEGSLPN